MNKKKLIFISSTSQSIPRKLKQVKTLQELTIDCLIATDLTIALGNVLNFPFGCCRLVWLAPFRRTRIFIYSISERILQKMEDRLTEISRGFCRLDVYHY